MENDSQTLATVSLMQASAMDHRIKLYQQICSKQIRLMNRYCYFVAFLITISTRNTAPF